MEPTHTPQHSLHNKNTTTRETLAPRTMELIRTIERRKRHLEFCRTAFLIWFILFIPLFVHYLIYMSADNIVRISLKNTAYAFEAMEAELFNENYLLNTNRSLVDYAQGLNESFRHLRADTLGMTQGSLLAFSLVGLVGAISIAQVLKSYKVG